MQIFFIFILGLIFGSFINALVYRLHKNISFGFVRSICPKCQKNLKWFELIPLVSFIVQQGRCKYCRKPISLQYPLVELVAGFLFILVFRQTFTVSSLMPVSFIEVSFLIGFFLLVIFLIIIFLYDLKYYLILDKITLPAMAIAILWNLTQDFSWEQIINLLVASLLAGGFFLLQFVLSNGKWIGGGDIRLGVLMGLILGWPEVLVALMLAYIIGAVWSVFMLLLKKKQWGSQIPFGTFLTVGTLAAMFWAKELINWYLSLL